jgi:hypothetical protein
LYSKLTVRREVVKKHKTNRLPQGNKIKTNQKPLRFFARALVALFVVVSLPLSASLLAPSSSVSAATGINHQINFQGKLVNPDGTNVTDGSYSIVYSIYSVPTAGTALWTETQTVTLANGIFQVNLGSVTPLPGSVDFNTDNIYLGIKVGADAEMTPRVQFTAVPQAFNAEKLGGVDKTGFIQNTTSPQTASFNVTGSGAIGTTLAVTGATTLSSTLAVTGAVTGGTYNGQTISSAASLTGTLAVTGATTLSSTLALTGNLTQTTGATISAGTGYKINGAAATAGTFLRGDGTNFVASTLQSGDITGGSTNYIQNTTTQQAASNVNISGAGVIGTTLSVAGTSSFGGAINLGAASTTTGQIKLYTSTNTGSVTLQGAATNGNYTVSIPNTIAANDTFCLLTAGNCGAGGAAIANSVSLQTAANFNIQALTSGTAGTIGGIIRGAAGGQTADLFQLQNSAGSAVLAKFDANGNLALGSATATISNAFTNGSLSIASNGTGQIVLGTVTDNMTLTSGTLEPVLNGTARHAKSISLNAEYTGSVLDAANDATCSGANNGSMNSGYDLANRQNYYRWTTTQVGAQCYDIVVQVPIPSDFAAWAPSFASISRYASVNTANTINLDIRDTTGTVASGFAYADITPATASTWNTATYTSLNGTYTPGGYMTIRVRLTSPTSGDVRVGNITLNYLSKY